MIGRHRITCLLAAAGLALSAGLAAAPAASAAPAAPANLTYHVWSNAAGWGDMFLNSHLDWIVSGNHTELSSAFGCNGHGYCEHQIGNDNCIAWTSGGVVALDPCTGAASQLWFLTKIIGFTNLYAWSNLASDQSGACNGAQRVLRATASGGAIQLVCPGSSLPNNEEWVIN